MDFSKFLIEKIIDVSGVQYKSMAHAIVDLSKKGHDFKKIKELTKASDTMVKWYMKHPEDVKDSGAITPTPAATGKQSVIAKPEKTQKPGSLLSRIADPVAQEYFNTEMNKYRPQTEYVYSLETSRKIVDSLNNRFPSYAQGLWKLDNMGRPNSISQSELGRIKFDPTIEQIAQLVDDKFDVYDSELGQNIWNDLYIPWSPSSQANPNKESLYIASRSSKQTPNVEYVFSGIPVGAGEVPAFWLHNKDWFNNYLKNFSSQKIAGFKKRKENEANAEQKAKEKEEEFNKSFDNKFWFGKYSGRTFDDIWNTDPNYLNWAYDFNIANDQGKNYKPSYITLSDKAFVNYVRNNLLAKKQELEQKNKEDREAKEQKIKDSLPNNVVLRTNYKERNIIPAQFFRVSKSGTKLLFRLDKTGKMLAIQKTKSNEDLNLTSGENVMIHGDYSSLSPDGVWVKLTNTKIIRPSKNIDII